MPKQQRNPMADRDGNPPGRQTSGTGGVTWRALQSQIGSELDPNRNNRFLRFKAWGRRGPGPDAIQETAHGVE
jgi:hypothetical protein